MILLDEKLKIPKFSNEEIKQRWKLIRQTMSLRRIDCLLILAADDFRYVCNYDMGRHQAYCILPLNGDPSLIVTHDIEINVARYLSPIHDQTFIGPIKLYNSLPGLVQESDAANWAFAIANKMKDKGLVKGTIGIDPLPDDGDELYSCLKKELPDVKFIDAGDVVKTQSEVPSPVEMEFVRKAKDVAETGFLAMANRARPGITEYELLGALKNSITSAGGETVDDMPYYIATQWPRKDGYPFHAGGSERKLQTGDIILMELVINYYGYSMDVVMPISLGKPPEDFIERFEINKGMCKIACHLIRPGVTVNQIRTELYEFLSSKGITKDRMHAKLVQWLSSPKLKNNETAIESIHFGRGVFKPGKVFSTVPLAWWDNGPNHMCGATVIVTEGEPEKLGKLPLEIIIV